MFKIIGTIMDVKGHCTARHKIGDKFELSGHNANGLCGFFYHDVFPTIITLQFGGTFPWSSDPDIVEVECPDRMNVVKMELKRIRK
ncbi:MAG: TIGR04076 family protein [Candidatus Thorarchaeota archaeon]